MKFFGSLILMLLSLTTFGQVKKDTVIYNYIYRDTIIYNVVVAKVDTLKDKKWKEIDLSNWGIGPYAGVDYSYYKGSGGAFGYTLGFGVAYYVWRLPVLGKNKKKHK